MESLKNSRLLRVVLVLGIISLIAAVGLVSYRAGVRTVYENDSHMISDEENYYEHVGIADAMQGLFVVERIMVATAFVTFVTIAFFIIDAFLRREKNDEILKEKETKMRMRLERDALTDLYNRNVAKDLIEKELGNKEKYMALLMFDLDGLKRINDSFGHDVGDNAIKSFANALREFFGKETVIARVGGDEFICFLKDAVEERMLKARLKSFLRNLVGYSAGGVVLSCSIGAAPVNEGNRSFNVLFKQADTAMYFAKNNGKNGYAFFRRSLEQEMLQYHKHMIEIYDSGDKKKADNARAHFDYKDAFVWLLDNYSMDMPARLLLKRPKDFIMIINPKNKEVLDVVTSGRGESSELDSFVGKKCYEAFKGLNRECDNCSMKICNHKAYTFVSRRSETLDCDYLERSRLAEYNGDECLVHVFREINDKKQERMAYIDATEAQNLITSCVYCDIDPIKNTAAYFKAEIETIARFFGAESGYIIRMDGDMETATYNIPEGKAPSFKVDMSAYAAVHWKTKLDQNMLVYVKDVKNLGTMEPRVMEFFQNKGTKNCCIAPIWDGVNIYGYVCLLNISQKEEELTTLCTIINLFRDVMRTVTEREEAINHRYYDETTGYLNYDGFKRQIQTIDLYDENRKYAICAWDIRNFNYINEVYGYEVGDTLLNEMADAFARKLGGGELLCRIAGDKFCALCEFKDADLLEERFRSLAESLSNYFSINYSGIFSIEMSIGIYLADRNERVELNEMLNMATIAEKKAKNYIGTTVLFYDGSMRSKAAREVLLNAEMTQAIKKKEFKIYLQPQVYVGDNTEEDDVAKAEVLCRWIRDDKNYSSPDEFIPLFEESGKITKLDMYMLEEACSLLKKVREEKKTKMCLSVNISRLTLLCADFINELDSITRKYDIKEKELELEFTERIAVTDFDKFYEVLGQLKVRGCLCAMDDFGSDYSSLNVLQMLPVDILKMDKKFFEVGNDPKRHDTIIENTIKMAKELNMKTIAEGIEDEEQVKALTEANCDYIQGFVFAKPMPVKDYLKWVEKEAEAK